jgi:hypothetical protein
MDTGSRNGTPRKRSDGAMRKCETAAVREGRVRRVIINLPPRHLKSHLASVALPAWRLGHDPGIQILCVTPGS